MRFRSPSPEVGRDGEAQPSPGGERQSRNGGTRLHPSPPGRCATTLPTSGEGERTTFTLALRKAIPAP